MKKKFCFNRDWNFPGLIKLLKVMKLTVFLLLVSVVGAFASKSYAQSKMLNLNMREATVKEVLNSVEKQSEFCFLYSENLIDVDRKINITIENKKIEQALKLIFEGTDVEYSIRDRFIVLTTPEMRAGELKVSQQQKTVSGKVADSSGTPLPGVTVVVKGTTQGTVTNADGEYSLSSLPANATLQFSFMGMKTLEVAVGNQTSINVVMEEETIGIDEVVAIGYGTARIRDLTGAVANVRIDELKAALPVSNVMATLQGTVPGLNVGAVDRPGGSPSLLIRGQNSITASNDPLIVVDDIIFDGSLTDINVNDIESINVLKDASSAAIYGSRAANGVIIITTKMGKTEKPTFRFKTRHGINTFLIRPEVMNGAQWVQKRLDYRKGSGFEADPNKVVDYLNIEERENYLNGHETDWVDVATQTGTVQDYMFGVSGRTDKTRYYLSTSITNEKGIVIGDRFKRHTLRVNVDNQVTEWLNIGMNADFSKRDYAGEEVSMAAATQVSPYGKTRDQVGKGEWAYYYPHGDNMVSHPLLWNNIDRENISDRLNSIFSARLDIPFIKGLSYTLNYNLSYGWSNIFEFFNEYTAQGKDQQYGGRTHTKNNKWLMDNIVNYKRLFNDLHDIDFTFLYNREYYRSTSTLSNGRGFANRILSYNDLSIADMQTIDNNSTGYQGLAYMGRLQYGYDEKYYLTLTIRQDGYSAFGQNNKFAVFPSAAFGWTISNESFMQSVSAIDRLKLRVSYGANGNQAISSYQTLAKIGTNPFIFSDNKTIFAYNINSMANPSLQWEKTKAFNIGMDFAVLDNRLWGGIDYYNSSTYDLILSRNIPVATGYPSILTNIGKVHNAGIEMSMNTINFRTNNFTWKTGLVFSLNRDRLIHLYGEDLDGDGKEDDDIGSSWFIGEPLQSIYNYKTLGVWQKGDDIYEGFKPGDFKIEDIDGDEKLTAKDRYIIANQNPNFRWGLSNTLTYKNWDLYVFINSIWGGGNKNYYQASNRAALDPGYFPERVNWVNIPYWTENNPTNKYSSITHGTASYATWLQDRTFIRLQDVSLSYTFNTAIVNKMKAQNLKIFLSGKNLLLWAKEWEHGDPETGSDYRGQPMLRSFNIGVDVSF